MLTNNNTLVLQQVKTVSTQQLAHLSHWSSCFHDKKQVSNATNATNSGRVLFCPFNQQGINLPLPKTTSPQQDFYTYQRGRIGGWNHFIKWCPRRYAGRRPHAQRFITTVPKPFDTGKATDVLLGQHNATDQPHTPVTVLPAQPECMNYDYAAPREAYVSICFILSRPLDQKKKGGWLFYVGNENAGEHNCVNNARGARGRSVSARPGRD